MFIKFAGGKLGWTAHIPEDKQNSEMIFIENGIDVADWDLI